MNVPKIRFGEFSKEWELTQFSKIASLRRGLTYTPSSIRNMGVRVLRSCNINEDTFVISEDDVFVTDECVNIAYANDGDILITAANGSPRLVGKHCIVRNPQNEPMAHGGFMLLASSDDSEFLNASMGAAWFSQFQKIGIAGGNGAIGNLNKHELENYSFHIPADKNERDSIAEYFKNLDSLIEATGKKVASLKQTKQACLQQMFPQPGETTPRIRFKGFEGEWEKKQLSDCLNISKETNADNRYSKEDVLSVSDEVGVVNQIKYLGRSFAGKSVANYGVLKTGQIVYTKSPLKAKPFGIVKQNLGESGIVSVLYAIYDAKDEVDAGYIHYYFDPAWRLNDYIRPLVNKGAKNTMNISDETALEGYITIPTLAEQQQIASFFSNLDKQIALQEQRLEKLKQVKAACLDNMFV